MRGACSPAKPAGVASGAGHTRAGHCLDSQGCHVPRTGLFPAQRSAGPHLARFPITTCASPDEQFQRIVDSWLARAQLDPRIGHRFRIALEDARSIQALRRTRFGQCAKYHSPLVGGGGNVRDSEGSHAAACPHVRARAAFIASVALPASLRQLCRRAPRSAGACPPRKSRSALREVPPSGIETLSPRLDAPYRAIHSDRTT